uniref:Skp1 domain-containing protein n=1 Tax=Macrostomum lignano TaxID=282301 RepID=A0A1I8JR81_9PLAT
MPNVKLLSSDNADHRAGLGRSAALRATPPAWRLPRRRRWHEIPVPNDHLGDATSRGPPVCVRAPSGRTRAPPEDDEKPPAARSVASGASTAVAGAARVFSVLDSEFLNLEPVCLFELLQAAAYLDVRGLVDACCLAVADMIRGRGPEDIRKTFNIKCDLTPQEEEQVRQELAWCHDPPRRKALDSLPDCTAD